MRRMWIMMVLTVLCTVPCLGAEIPEVPGLEEFWGQAGEYGVTEGQGLDRGLSDLLARPRG